ncbi:MAG TPA: leucine--tRNA ligase [Anaerolineaceae bacterium]|nr:leucine--tRNA ligase [Longilinea sp.]HNZ13311.1 leucine--tRNA ligase [Anaerolineaceae bacterium]HOG79337.1 leucine--tRNA ligase [Anaerolineaceae bacterium]
MSEQIYNPAEIEARWQARWAADRLYEADVDPARPKHYALTMLPYPSGDLHIGHWYAMTPSDAQARFMRMQGYNVLFPMGFDAFGLPAENAAIRDNIHPRIRTMANIERMRKQMRRMGAMFDWRREIVTCDPAYYRWTQWFFVQFYKNGLAYRKHSPVDWCPKCNTTLAREQVWGDDRHCERCGTPVIKKNLDQWFFRTTRYAEELLSYEGLDWPETVRVLQTNWIGRSNGAHVTFTTETGSPLTVFTTRPDTLWGVTFMVLAPEHPLVAEITSEAQRPLVQAYIEQATRQTDVQREAADKEKTGVFTGGYAINPVNGERVPIWIADYVLMTYGTGAIMAVPAHDQRDFEFARKFNLPIRIVIQPSDLEPIRPEDLTAAVPASGDMVNSGPLTGTPGAEAFQRAVGYLEARGLGNGAVNYKLRDWLISRQRYWGAPIPIVYCPACGPVAVPESQLPVLLPDDVEWKPTGESPLKLHPTWRFTTCPQCGGPAERETDTMDTFMCSSWYHLGYLNKGMSDQYPFPPEEYDYWMPVDTYTGGIEHATMHLIYTRFFHKACRDVGITEGHSGMLRLRNQGMVLGEDGEKMSKSRGNVIAPDDLVDAYGADTIRAFLMFFCRWEMGGPWSSGGIEGTSRWLRRVWSAVIDPAPMAAPDPVLVRQLRRKVHQTLRSVTRDYQAFEFNTIVSSLMELMNEMLRVKSAGLWNSPAWNEAVELYLKMLAPICPHISEELWARLGKPYSIHNQLWPAVDEAAAAEDEITLVVQVNGKVRDRITLPADVTEEAAKAAALSSEVIQKHLEGKPPRQVVYVRGRLVNIVV